MRNIAIIPARSGSKGIKDKNIRLLNGKPLLSYTIEAALESHMFDEVYVSTDSCKYAEIAREYGASVPFLRSKKLSSDNASSWDVVSEALRQYAEHGQYFDSFSLLQPTSPARSSNDIIAGYKLMNIKSANAIVGVCETDHSPIWCNTLPEDLSLENFLNKDIVSLPRQSLPRFYRVNGALYIVGVEYFNSRVYIYSYGCYAYIMEKKNSIDIDDEIDFKLAEILLSSVVPANRCT